MRQRNLVGVRSNEKHEELVELGIASEYARNHVKMRKRAWSGGDDESFAIESQDSGVKPV